MPLVFSFHRLVLFHMPNRTYYFLSSCTSAQLYSSIMSITVYVSLEFVSLVIIVVVLKRTFGFSVLSQLAFVFEQQASTVQMKIVTNFVYIMQTTLIHVGLDFSFKFAWLHAHNESL
ncbi:hypothetical protein V7S43_000191 [Phytophthora oleae]|uniref:Uncharacterized protein n=1 Tax=Phytophthora oleae TaxID=2107226 RepID=A0ABD3G509_9STRA